MNDSLSLSDSTPSSSNNSNSNSLNRSLINSSIYGNSSVVGVDYLSSYYNSAARKRSKSLVSNYRDYYDQNLSKLKDELIEARKLVKEKDDMIFKLNDIRDRLESEIRELSACLFEQAYAMVNAAKDETAQSNKLLNEANGKIDVLEAEVKALKALVLTSTPSEPNKHLHPQLLQSSSIIKPIIHSTQLLSQQTSINSTNTILTSNTTLSSSTSLFQFNSNQTNLINKNNHNLLTTPNKNLKASSHKRTPSHNDVIQNQQYYYNNNQQSQNVNNCDSGINNALKCEIYEIDPIYFKEIVLWRENPDLSLTNLFLARVYQEDIMPCINFNNNELSKDLLNSIQSNCVCIEDISSSHPIETMQICSLSNVPSICQYKIKFNDSLNSQWYLISKLCRNRIISVCDFFTYMRYIKDGLVKSDNRDVYWHIIDLRKRMSLSRLGL